MNPDRRITLVTGGARSGKSALAETLAGRAGGPLVYVATAEARELLALLQALLDPGDDARLRAVLRDYRPEWTHTDVTEPVYARSEGWDPYPVSVPVTTTIAAVRELLNSGKTPPPDYGKRCKTRSMVEICQPELLGSWIGV